MEKTKNAPPYFSVIIPTYNRAHLISDTIRSVLDQSFPDFELIIVDDGSTDETKEVIASIDDRRLNYVWQENGERGKARNHGVQKATGSYVFFLDSDDFIQSTYLVHAFEQIQKLKEPEFFHIRYQLVSDDSTEPVPLLHKETVHQKVNRQNQFACQFFLRKDIALSFPFLEDRRLKIGEDWYVILRIGQRYPFHFSNEVLGEIRQGERSMEAPATNTVLKSRDILLSALKLDNKIPTKVLKNVKLEFTFLAALSASLEGKRRRAIQLWFQSFVQKPGILFKRRTLAMIKYILRGGL